MKVYVLIVDHRSGIYQSGMIDEPVMKGKEIENALGHFGISNGTVDWETHLTSTDPYSTHSGKVEGTSKVVTVVTIQ